MEENLNYNEEPVFYCKQCLSLKIRGLEGFDYCDECGSTNIEKTDIHSWEKLYEQNYGKKYINYGRKRS